MTDILNAKVQLTDNPGKEDDLIRRIDAIATVTQKEGWYPASLWYVPAAKTKQDP